MVNAIVLLAAAINLAETVSLPYDFGNPPERRWRMTKAPADAWARYVPTFNQSDEELYANAISNAEAEEFLRANAPSFECPDKEIERTYHFRWWTFRKHLKRTANGGWVITEFLPPVGWAGPENTINCASGHHVREGRWLADARYVYDYLKFLLEKGRTRSRGAYAWWPATSLTDWLDVTGETEKALALLPLLKENFAAWERGWICRSDQGCEYRAGLDEERGLFTIVDGYEGTELSLTGTGYRPLVNAALCAEASALARFCRLARDEKGADCYQRRAEALAQGIRQKLWDDERGFFMVRRLDGTISPVRELHGYAPWYFGLPLDASYDRAFAWLLRDDGFLAPRGLTFPERSAKGFAISYEGHACQWNGPSWPLSTSVALTALANRLHADRPMKEACPADFVRLLHQYAAQHRRTREDGTVVPWIDENLNPFTGDWIARTMLIAHPPKKMHFRERGKDYNHSTFCDLVISGLVGVRRDAQGAISAHPICPDDWAYFNLENLHYRGRVYSIRYRKGAPVEIVEK